MAKHRTNWIQSFQNHTQGPFWNMINIKSVYFDDNISHNLVRAPFYFPKYRHDNMNNFV